MNFVMRSVVVLILVYGARAWGQPVLPTLPAGTAYRVAFVTSSESTAMSPFINDYNLFVNNVASTQPALAGITWTAIASTSTVDAIGNTGTNGLGVPIYLLDGSTKIADDYFDLWDASLDNPLNITEMGTPFVNGPVATKVWTGTETNGLRRPSGELGSPVPVVGEWSLSNPDWVLQQARNNTEFHSLYAISNELIATVPEPSAFLCIALVGVTVTGFRRFNVWSSTARGK